METVIQVKKVYQGEKTEILKEISIEIKISGGITTAKLDEVLATISEAADPLLSK